MENEQSPLGRNRNGYREKRSWQEVSWIDSSTETGVEGEKKKIGRCSGSIIDDNSNGISG